VLRGVNEVEEAVKADGRPPQGGSDRKSS
jgi:hypothetical protein